MEITSIKSKWEENRGFCLERQDIGDEYIFIQFLSPVNILIEGELQKVNEGSCILYNKHAHQYFESPSAPLLHDWFHLKGNLDEVTARYGFEYNKIYQVRFSNEITHIVRKIEEEFLVKPEFYEDVTEIKIRELLIKILRDSGFFGENGINPETAKQFLSFRSKMSGSYQEPWTIPQMAKEVGFSQSRFCKLYRDIFGITPKRDLQLIRIEQAKLFLMQKQYSVSTVAQMCGYTNPFHFIRAFKTETGLTPFHYSQKFGRC